MIARGAALPDKILVFSWWNFKGLPSIYHAFDVFYFFWIYYWTNRCIRRYHFRRLSLLRWPERKFTFFAKPFQSILNMLERSCIWVEQILKVWNKFIEAHRSASRKSFLFIFLARGVTRKCVSGYPTHLIPTAGAHGCHWLVLVWDYTISLSVSGFNKNILKHCLKLIYAWNRLASNVWRWIINK